MKFAVIIACDWERGPCPLVLLPTVEGAETLLTELLGPPQTSKKYDGKCWQWNYHSPIWKDTEKESRVKYYADLSRVIAALHNCNPEKFTVREVEVGGPLAPEGRYPE